MNRMNRRALRTSVPAVLAMTALVGLTGCSASTGSVPTASESVATGAAGFPVTVENCGSEVTLEAKPDRIVLVNNDSLPNLEALDAVDRVVAVTSPLQEGLYDDATYSTLGALDVLSTEKNSTGGSIVSEESILGAEPDLVIAPENAVDRSALAAAGIALYTPTAYCLEPGAALIQRATFDRVWDELDTLGSLLGVPDTAERVIAEAEPLVGTPAADEGTAAALYVSSGGSVLSPYGGPSMVTAVFEAAGLTNVYADAPERVFDANVEDLIARDPGTIVLLYSSGDPQLTIDSFLTAPGVSGLSAVASGRVVALQFPYTDPPSMLSIQGPAELTELLATLK